MFRNTLSLIILSSFPFLFSLNGDFVFDDSEAIIKNKDVTSGIMKEIFTNDFWGMNIKSNLSHKSYRPLTVLTFRVNFLLGNGSFNAFHFKLTNLLCHTICCILVWYSYLIIMAHCNYDSKKSTDIAFLAASLFAVHPIHTEAICGIVGRADVLAGITFFISFLFFHATIKYDENHYSLLKWFCFLFTIIFATASMLFKENGITVLGLCIIYEFINNPRWGLFIKKILFRKEKYEQYQSLKLKHPVTKSFTRIVLLLFVIVLLIYIRWSIMGHTKPNFKAIDNPTAFSDNYFTKVTTYSYIYFLNILLLLWPEWLCFDWSMGCVPLIKNIFDHRIIFVFLLYCYAVKATYSVCFENTKYRNKRLMLMSFSMLILPFLPAANIFFNVGFVLAERILYIPSSGYCLLVSIGFHLIESKYARHSKIMKYAFHLVLLTYALKCWQRSFEWQNEYRLFTSGLNVCPLNAKVHYNVAKVSDANNHTQWALFEYKEAIRLHPEYYQAMNNLANLLKNMKLYSEAEYYLRKAIRIKMDFPAAWMNLGIVLASTARYYDAEIAYKTAIKHRNNYPDCYYNLGNMYLEKNEKELAMEAWKHAINLDSHHVLAWTNLLALLDNTGQNQEALKVLPKALAFLPTAPSIHFVAANIYGKVSQYEEAETHFFKAIKLFGSHVQAIHYSNFGVLYHRWKKYDEALRMYEKALEIDPAFKSALNNLNHLKSRLQTP